MSAMVLQFRAPRPRPEMRAGGTDWARSILAEWVRTASHYGWFLVEPKPAGRRGSRKLTRLTDATSFTIGHRAVDNDGIYQLTPEFDGWALLSRRGELTVYHTLQDALASICPATIAA